MGRQLRVQRPPIRNISDLRDRCLNIWYNLPRSATKDLWHPCQGIKTKCAKEWDEQDNRIIDIQSTRPVHRQKEIIIDSTS
ncbi:hypothetical protein NPIL_471681 [Nephila pilipes]|uniref:Uncharacterized protein n=1 Tax=Nephila pilipes TaxID=299642 RepID=A0A8X6TMY6_NEPPI|nr:hypothetical protein NPIL_471681 [Nephila pilipes]